MSDEKKKSPPASPFAALEGLRASLPAGTAQGSKIERAQRVPARAVVRYERKGRGGKEVTVIEQLELSDKDLAAWLKALKGALGCGGAVEDRALVLQGDHRERARKLLEERGVRKVSVG